MDILVSDFVLFMLIFTRVISLVVVAPVVGHQVVPVHIKIGLGLFVSLLLFPLVSSTYSSAPVEILSLAILALKEIVVGLIIGFSVGLLFEGVRYAGELIGFDMGITFANVFDPENGHPIPVVGEMLYLMGILIFLLINGHHFLLEALQLSYKAVPPGEFTLTGPLLAGMTALGTLVFAVAVKFAAPVIVAGFLTNIALGILARVMPQINLFMLSFPIKIGVGLLMLAAATPLMIVAFEKTLAKFEESIMEIIAVM